MPTPKKYTSVFCGVDVIHTRLEADASSSMTNMLFSLFLLKRLRLRCLRMDFFSF